MSRKRKQQIAKLVQARTEFAGVGTRKAKLMLNKLAKTDRYTKALRVALEIEDVNLTAKRYYGGDCGGYTFAEVAYLKKCESIAALIEIAKSDGWVFGVLPSDVENTTHVIYFEIPGVGQVSWHYSPQEPLPEYPGTWDGEISSTLPRLDAAISALFAERAVA